MADNLHDWHESKSMVDNQVRGWDLRVAGHPSLEQGVIRGTQRISEDAPNDVKVRWRKWGWSSGQSVCFLHPVWVPSPSLFFDLDILCLVIPCADATVHITHDFWSILKSSASPCWWRWTISGWTTLALPHELTDTSDQVLVFLCAAAVAWSGMMVLEVLTFCCSKAICIFFHMQDIQSHLPWYQTRTAKGSLIILHGPQQRNKRPC